MIKVMLLGKRKPGLSQEEFSRHLREVHGPLALKYVSQLGFKRYIQNLVMGQPDAEVKFDNVAEFWFHNIEGFEAFITFLNSEDGKALRDDVEKFTDRSTEIFFFVEENVVL